MTLLDRLRRLGEEADELSALTTIERQRDHFVRSVFQHPDANRVGRAEILSGTNHRAQHAERAEEYSSRRCGQPTSLRNTSMSCQTITEAIDTPGGNGI